MHAWVYQHYNGFQAIKIRNKTNLNWNILVLIDDLLGMQVKVNSSFSDGFLRTSGQFLSSHSYWKFLVIFNELSSEESE